LGLRNLGGQEKYCGKENEDLGVKSYRDLDVYKMSFKCAVKCHELSLSLPKYELYEEGSQLRRSSKAITANIVEGYGRKKYKAEFVKFLIYAHSSCDETICHLEFILTTNSAVKNLYEDLVEKYNELGAKINKFITFVEDEWQNDSACEPSRTRRATRNS